MSFKQQTAGLNVASVDGLLARLVTSASSLTGAAVRALAGVPVRHYLSARIGASDGSSVAFTNTSTFTTVPLTTVDYDTAGGFNPTTGLYRIPVTGYWQINAAIRPVDGQAVRQIGVGVDTSSGDSASFAWLQTYTNRTTLLYSRSGHFAVGDQVRLFTYADANGTTNFNTAALTLTLLGT